MTDFNIRVWNGQRIYMVDFGRGRHARHPHRSCPDVDRYGHQDDANPAEHGPIVSARVGQPRVDVRFYRTEISTSARLYAVAADGNATIRILAPAGALPNDRAATLSFRPVAAGRTSIDIHYHWPDGPVIGRLYVVVRATRTIRCRIHLVTVNGVGFSGSFLGEAIPAGTLPPAAQLKRTNRITTVFRDANHVLEPHGIQLVVSETVNTAWTNASFGAAGPRASRRAMQAMALSPNRGAARLNVYFVDWTQVSAAPGNPGFALGFVALGPPISWATAIGASFANAAGGTNLGNGILADTSASPFTGSILAHEFGHIFNLCALTAAGAVQQWHSIGDNNASRDDIATRRRLMYPWTSLGSSANAWRRDVGYGANMGALLTQRRLTQDATFEESLRAWNRATAAAVYAA